MKKLLIKLLNKRGYSIYRTKFIDGLIDNISDRNSVIDRLFFWVNQLENSNPQKSILTFLEFLKKNKFEISKSQLFQDLFVLFILDEKRHGFFIEFGATDGIKLSNTYLLERSYNWSGILAEPGMIWHSKLKKNRQCFVDERCVWSKTGMELVFYETDYAELSTLENFHDSDYHQKSRQTHKEYKVKTISLNDLLKYYNAPKKIDYLSIDTEGSEFDILNSFDFNNYDISIITIEHNFNEQREKIFNLLSLHGYVRVYESLSQFDDWYIKKDLIVNLTM